MKTFIRIYTLCVGTIYWIGVFSGYYAAHGPYSNWNPNTYINPGVGVIFVCTLIDWYREHKQSGPSLKEEGK